MALHSQHRGPDSIPGQGTRLHATVKDPVILSMKCADMQKNQFTSLQTWKSESVTCDMTHLKVKLKALIPQL